MYSLDRNSFKVSKFNDNNSHSSYYKNMDWRERLRIVIFLNRIAFKLIGKDEPKMDRALFSTRSING